MNTNLVRDRLLASTIIAGAILGGMPAFAQDAIPGATTPAETGGGDIIVTGSRIPQPNLTSASPITVVNSQDIKLQGTTRVEDLLNTLPQVFADQGGNLANGATGTATVNLRGLGSQRTLVLVNGRRLLPGDIADPSPDINTIPSALVKRVDVFTGGASSTYGADAVSGVVNFIMDTDFEGIKLDGQYSLYNHNNRSGVLRQANQDRIDSGATGFGYPNGLTTDGGTIDTTLTIGTGFDDNRGHVVAYVGYRKINAVTQDRRDYSSCTSQANTDNSVVCGGSLTSPSGTFFDFNSNSYQTGPGRTFSPGFTRYNFAPTNYYQRPDERYTAGFFAHYDINDSIKPYTEFMFMDDRSVAQIAESGDFGNTLTLNCGAPGDPSGPGNPLLSAQQRAILCAPGNLVNGSVGSFPLAGETDAGGGLIPATTFIDPTTGQPYNKGFMQILRRNIEGGPRQDDLQHTSYRAVIGSKGSLGEAWSYDAYYMYGRTNFAETYSNEFSISRLNKALDVVSDPTTGNPVCRAALSGDDRSCVPYDIFTPGGVSQAALNYLQATGFQRGQTEETVASANVTGLLGKYGIKTPWAEDGVGVNFGAEYRKEALHLQTDLEFQTGDLSGQGGATLPVDGSFTVKELFGEMRVPIVQDGFIYDLSLTGGYRYSDYKIGGGNGSFKTDTYKFEVNFAPIRDIRFRGSYNRAVRAPNIQELFATQHVALNGSADPCAGFTITAADLGCLAQGLSIGDNIAGNPAGQYNGLIGGDINLKPEVATTKTIGVVIQPSFIRGLAITVDGFDIKVKKAIQGFGQDTILATCVQTQNPEICSLIHRDAKGSLWLTTDGYVVDLQRNVGGVRTRGIDVGASYNHQIGSIGSAGFSFNGTYLDKLSTDTGISTPYDCAGLYGLQCGIPAPQWRHKARVTFTTSDGFGVSLQWRYLSQVKVDLSSSNPSLAGPFSPFNAKIPAQSYFDLAFTARIGDHYNFRLGANNVLDKRPPIIGSNGTSSQINACFAVLCSGNTYPQVYDALGRYIYAGVTLDF